MIKWIGAALCGLSAAYMGLLLSRQLQRSLQAVTDFRDSLLLMKQKISFYRLPLPQLFRELALESRLPSFYAKAADHLEKNSRQTAEAVLLNCLEECRCLGLPEEGRACCRRLMASLGRMDGEHQPEALQRAVDELDTLEAQLRCDLQQKGRCYRVIGICGGLAAAIVLV